MLIINFLSYPIHAPLLTGVKAIRFITGLGLKESKESVDSLKMGNSVVEYTASNLYGNPNIAARIDQGLCDFSSAGGKYEIIARFEYE